MVFINPKTDFAFKKIFGSDGHQDILISFLNGILYNGRNTIQDLDILNPYQAPRIRGFKATYLDVKAHLDNGTTVIIEMQVLNVEGFEQRILYNAAKAYSSQLSLGQAYSTLNPVIALTITDFVMFSKQDELISRFILKEKEHLFDYPVYDLELVFVELPKFNRSLGSLESLMDKWIYFLRYAPEISTVPESLQTVTAIQRAFDVANHVGLTPEELDTLEREEFFIQDQRGAIAKAVNQAVAKASKQSIKQTQTDIARRLLPIMDNQEISDITSLSVEVIASLRQTLN